MEVRKLERTEHQKTRFLYEEVFTQDSQSFVDYYYTEKTKDNDIYIYGIKDFVVTFDEVEYELPAVLSSNKLDINKLIKDAKNIVTDLKDPNNKTTLYELEDYNIVVCDPNNSKDIIFTSPKLTLEDITCTVVE